MKKTLYFKTTTEVEEYYPNGVPSNVIAIVGEGSNVFISSDNDNLKNQKFFNADLTNDEIVAEQVADAEASGYETGHAEGYSEGETAGYTAGEAAGYDTGYSAGETAGYTDGYQNGTAAGEASGYNAAEAVKNCLKFTNVNNSGASTIQLTYSAVTGSEWLALGNSIQFSRDGIHWELWTFSRVPLELENKGDFIYVKSGLGYFSKDTNNYVKFIMTGNIAASGDITSLLNEVGGDVDLSTNNRSYNFYSLFKGCTALTSAPKLPSTILSSSCYANMFEGCTLLTTAPELPATTLADHCYEMMFYNCTALNSITCLATTLALDCLVSWTKGVAASGTFIKKGAMTSFTTGVSGIPSGWTVENYGDYDNGYTAGETAGYDQGYAAGGAADNYANKYFTIEFTEVTDVTEYTDPDSGDLVEYTPAFSIGLNYADHENSTVYIRINGGEWQHLTDNYVAHPDVDDIIEIKATGSVLGDMLNIDALDESRFYDAESGKYYTAYKYNVYGNIMSLLEGDDFADATLDDNYTGQFSGAFGGTGLVDARNLILPENTTEYCYNEMFLNCEFLTHAPILGAQTLSEYCYTDMFSGCSALEYVVILAGDDGNSENYDILFGTDPETGDTVDNIFKGGYEGYLVTLFDKYEEMDPDATVMIYYPTTQSQYYSDDCEEFCLRLYGLTEAYDDGHSEGYAAGEADGATNWIDVLYLDAKTQAETYLGITGTWPGQGGGFQKYNYNNGVPYDGALGLVQGLQTSKTLMKLIKITKDANDNSIVTSQAFNFNYDGTNIGEISLDGNTYSTKLCFWSTVTLAAGDEVILDCAAQIEYQGATLALGLFGGSDANSSDPTTYKCETAGTYTFAMTIDPPQNNRSPVLTASLAITTMFNYTGSATVPAITVPTGEASGGGGSSTLTIEELNNMSIGTVLASLYATGAPYIEMQQGDIDYLDAEVAKTARDATSLHFTVDKYNETDGLTIDYNTTFTTDNNTYMRVQLSLDAGDKAGFSFTPADTDGMGDYVFGRCTWLFRYVDPDNTGNGYNTHWWDAQDTGTYEFTITFGEDPETGDTRLDSITFTKVDLR